MQRRKRKYHGLKRRFSQIAEKVVGIRRGRGRPRAPLVFTAARRGRRRQDGGGGAGGEEVQAGAATTVGLPVAGVAVVRLAGREAFGDAEWFLAISRSIPLPLGSIGLRCLCKFATFQFSHINV